MHIRLDVIRSSLGSRQWKFEKIIQIDCKMTELQLCDENVGIVNGYSVVGIFIFQIRQTYSLHIRISAHK